MVKTEPNKVTAVLRVVVIGEFYDDEASEETLRYCVEQDLEDAGFDVDVALLKEQEAVEPKTGHWIVLEYCANEGIYCSKCHMKIFDRLTKPKKNLSQYCPHCGSRNEQFFRNGEVVFR